MLGAACIADKRHKARTRAEALRLSKVCEAHGNRREAHLSIAEHEAQKICAMLT